MLTEIKWFINQLVGDDIRNNVISLKAANLEQANLLAHFYDFVKKTKPQDL